MLPLERFLPKPPAPKVKRAKGNRQKGQAAEAEEDVVDSGEDPLEEALDVVEGRQLSFPWWQLPWISSRGRFSRGSSRGGRGGY